MVIATGWWTRNISEPDILRKMIFGYGTNAGQALQNRYAIGLQSALECCETFGVNELRAIKERTRLTFVVEYRQHRKQGAHP